MKYIIAKWKKGCNGEQYTLHAVRSMSPTSCFWGIDELGDPGSVECYRGANKSDMNPKTLKEITWLNNNTDGEGYIDNPDFEISKLWEKSKSKIHFFRPDASSHEISKLAGACANSEGVEAAMEQMGLSDVVCPALSDFS